MTEKPTSDSIPPVTETGSHCVFVMGAGRSGTGALAWAIAQHPDVWTGPEMDFPFYLCSIGGIEEIWQKAVSREAGWLANYDVSSDEFMAAVGRGLDLMILSRSDGLRWVDSTPNNVIYSDQLALYFPNGKFIHIIRDGRAVVNSFINSGFDVPPAKDFKRACRAWDIPVRAGLKARQVLTDRIMEVRHEEMSQDPESFMYRVQCFLDLEPVPDCAHFLLTNRINSSYGDQYNVDLKSAEASAGRPVAPWRDWSKKQRKTFTRYCRDLMIELGYDSDLT